MNHRSKIEITLYMMSLLSIIILPIFYPNHQIINPSGRLIPPQWLSSPHLGSDALGRLLALRLIKATSTSLLLSLTALITSLLLSLMIAISASWLPRIPRKVILWLPKALFIIPTTFFSATLFNLWHNYTLALWLTLMIAPLFSLTQHLMLSLTTQQSQAYWLYTTATASSPYYCIRYHQLPYALAQITAFAITRLSTLIVLEGSLSFLGLGLQDPHLSLGLLLQESLPYMQSYPYLFFIPALSFFFLLFLLQWMTIRVQKLLQEA